MARIDRGAENKKIGGGLERIEQRPAGGIDGGGILEGALICDLILASRAGLWARKSSMLRTPFFVLQAGCKPAHRIGTVAEARCAVAGVAVASGSTHGSAHGQGFADLAAAMYQFEEVEYNNLYFRAT